MQAPSRERKKRKVPREEADSQSTSTAVRDTTPSASELTIIWRSGDDDETDPNAFDEFGGPELNFTASYARIGERPLSETAIYAHPDTETHTRVVDGPSIQQPQSSDEANAAFWSTTQDAGATELEVSQLGVAHICAMRRVINEQWREIHRLSRQVDAHNNEKNGMQVRLEEERQQYMQKKQEAVLNRVSLQKKFDEETEKLKKRIASLTQYTTVQGAEIERLETAVDKKEDEAKQRQDRILKMQANITDLESQLECAERGRKTQDGDIEELRQMYLEDTSRTERQKQGLPPAYGSLDQEIAPWDQHKDAGAYQLSRWKYLVRSQFQQGMQTIYDRISSKREQKTSTSILFISGFMVMKDCCVRLRSPIDLHEAAHGGSSRGAAGSPFELRGPWGDVAANKKLIGRLIATLVLEMPMALISGYELCSGDLAVSPREMAMMKLCFQTIDEVLLAALRFVFSSPTSEVPRQYRLFTLQRYLTETETIKEGLSCYGDGACPQVFKQCQDWLNEQIEATRVRAAADADAARGA